MHEKEEAECSEILKGLHLGKRKTDMTNNADKSNLPNKLVAELKLSHSLISKNCHHENEAG